MSQAYGARCPKGTLHQRSKSSPLCVGIPFQTQTASSSRTALDIALCYTNRLRRARLGRDLIGQIDRMFSGPPAAMFSSRTLHRNSPTMHGMLSTTGAPHASWLIRVHCEHEQYHATYLRVCHKSGILNCGTNDPCPRFSC